MGSQAPAADSSPEVQGAVAALAAAPAVLVALDFDGTVSPLVDDPAQSRIVPEALAAIAALRMLPSTSLAFVSGRSLASLRRVTASVPDALLVGSHGGEILDAGEVVTPELDAAERDRLAALAAELQLLVDAVPGARLERKPLGLGVHTRLADPAAVPGLHERSRVAAAAVGGFTPRDGKDILEFAAKDVTKGDGIARLRELLGGPVVLYAGDDVTDEDAFRSLGPGDLGVKVGEGVSAASARVAGPEALGEFLRVFAALRSQYV